MSSYVSNLTVYDDALYFTADAGSNARGLWRYAAPNGPAELVVLLSPEEGGLGHLTVANGRLYFTVEELLETGVFPRIWAYDAGAEAAMQITDLVPLSALVPYNDRLFFTAYTDSTGNALWAYDVATDATALVATGPVFDSGIGDPTVYADRLFFRAQPDPFLEDYELWAYDAATGEVTQAAEINLSGSSYPNGLTVYDDRLFFAARDVGSNEELWAYDAGTGEATEVAAMAPGDLPSAPRHLTPYAGRLYFSVIGDNYDGDLWAYDAGVDAAELVIDAAQPTELAVLEDRLYFGSGSGLRAYDATSDEVSELSSDVRPHDLTVYEGRLFFSGFDTEHGVELWVYDAPVATSEEPDLPHVSPVLSPAFPNPTIGPTTLTLTLSEAQRVRLAVYDALGREVAVLHDGVLPSASHSLHLDGTPLPSGLYFVRAIGEDFVATQRVTVLR